MQLDSHEKILLRSFLKMNKIDLLVETECHCKYVFIVFNLFSFLTP